MAANQVELRDGSFLARGGVLALSSCSRCCGDADTLCAVVVEATRAHGNFLVVVVLTAAS
eukprot:305577-Prorocentrum_lima.AAC.1